MPNDPIPQLDQEQWNLMKGILSDQEKILELLETVCALSKRISCDRRQLMRLIGYQQNKTWTFEG